MARFPGPLAYMGAGVGGGIGEGFILGQEAARRKREEERLKQGQALQLLLGIYKGAQDNPEMAQAMVKQLEPWLQKQGFQAPQFPTSEQKLQKQITQFKSAEQEIDKAFPNATPEQKLQIAAGIVNFPFKVARPQATAGAKWFVNPQGEMRAFSAQNPPPPGEGWKPYEKPGQPKAWEQPTALVDKQGNIIANVPHGAHVIPDEKPVKTPEVESKILAMAQKAAMGSRDWLRAKTQEEQQALIDKWADYYRKQMGSGGTPGPWKGGGPKAASKITPEEARQKLKAMGMSDAEIDAELSK